MAKKEVKKQKKESLLIKVALFFKSVWYELKKVTWPSKSELIQHTSVVLGIVVIMTAIVWVIDFGIGSVLSLII